MLTDYQQQYALKYSIGQLTPTICRCCNAPLPRQCEATPLSEVLSLAHERFQNGNAKKVLIYNPDAIGDDLLQRYPEILAPVQQESDLQFKSASVMQCVTPVCFATIYSGASPDTHQIKTYVKPVLTVETLFDMLPQAGYRMAIVARNECSIDTIFRKRNIDYYSTRDDRAAFEMTLHLLNHFDYDVIISYNGDFDNHVHHNGGPYSQISQEVLCESVKRYKELIRLTDQVWGKFDRITVFAPDHGAHPEGDHGSHGLNIPEDMIVNHFYRLRKGDTL